MYKNLLLTFIILQISAAKAQIGVNISLPERGGTYIDLAKENYRWTDFDGNSLDQSEVDDSGWPEIDARFVIDWRPVAEWANSIDDPEVYRIDVSGTYSCSFEGQGDVSGLVGGSVQELTYDENSNTTSFDFVIPPASNGFVLIDFTNTQRTSLSDVGSGFTNFKMLRPGYVNDDQLFTNDFLDLINMVGFESIRYMAFSGTNGTDPDYPAQLEWATRKLPTDAGQNSMSVIGKPYGGCWEHVIRLSNVTGTDPWINVPISASDDYVRQLAALFLNNLDPDLNLYVESSNEVWNTAPGFEQTFYNRDEAEDLGISEIQNHVRRSVELAQLFEEVFGQGSLNNRIRVIHCYHRPMLKWSVEPMLQYVDDNFGPPSNYLYGLACQTYFDGGDDAGESVTKVLDDCEANIRSQIDGAGTTNEAGNMQWVAKATEWNLPGGFFSYEGGPHHGGGTTNNMANRISAERSERMGELLTLNYKEAFLDNGGRMAMQFTLTSSYNRYGYWGLTDDVSVPHRNYKLQAIMDIIDVIAANEVVEDIQNSSLMISPNPVLQNTSIQFYLEEAAEGAFEIYNLTGSKVHTFGEGFYSEGMHHLFYHLPPFEQGVYLLKANFKNKALSRKIVISQ